MNCVGPCEQKKIQRVSSLARAAHLAFRNPLRSPRSTENTAPERIHDPPLLTRGRARSFAQTGMQDRGDCQTTRKSYNTSHIGVGQWVEKVRGLHSSPRDRFPEPLYGPARVNIVFALLAKSGTGVRLAAFLKLRRRFRLELPRSSLRTLDSAGDAQHLPGHGRRSFSASRRIPVDSRMERRV
jgi:hypothetical protein